jgi:DNA-binding LytR/AlgR family response regulator
MISYLIVDDEPIAHGIIENYCENLSYLSKKGNCYNAKEAIESLYKKQVDLIFLDINMPGISGFEFLRSLTNPPKIIVTSAYQEFAVEGFELNICDYLLKPFSFERFMKAINKVSDQVQSPQKFEKDIKLNEIKESDQIFIKSKGGKKLHRISESNITFIEAAGNYSKIILENEIITTHKKISDFEEELSEERFIRIHKSFIVAIDKIKSIDGNIIEVTGHSISIGQTYKKSIQKKLGIN